MNLKLNDYCITYGGLMGQVTDIEDEPDFPILITWSNIKGLSTNIDILGEIDNYTRDGKFWDNEIDYLENEKLADIEMVITKEDNPEYFL